MSNQFKKDLSKKDVLKSRVRIAIKNAIAKNENIHIVMDGRPCSIEIGRTSKGDLTWNVKIYTVDAQESLATVPVIKSIENAIRKAFLDK